MVKLEVDWGYTPEGNQRIHGRISGRYLSKFYFNNTLDVYISTLDRDYNGIILDLSAGGMLISTSQLIKSKTVKVSFLVGRKRIISVAEVKRENIVDNGYEYGIMFLNLKEGDRNLLNDLFVNKILQYGR